MNDKKYQLYSTEVLLSKSHCLYCMIASLCVPSKRFFTTHGGQQEGDLAFNHLVVGRVCLPQLRETFNTAVFNLAFVISIFA